MKVILTVNLWLLIFSSLCIGQELTYTYPFSLSKVSEDVTSVEMFSEVINDFDTLNINGDFEFESEPIAKRYLEKGRIIKIQNYKDDFELLYQYDKNGNIQSRVSNRSVGTNRVVRYNLDQKELKLEAILGDVKREERQFDSLNREFVQLSYSKSSSGEKVLKYLTIYDGDNILRKESYKNEVLERIENYEYRDDKIKRTKTVDVDGNLLEIKNYSYYEGREEIEIIRFKNQESSRTLKVDFFDKKENLIKAYIISFTENGQTALIGEFRPSF